MRERERESKKEKEGRMTWRSVGAGIMTWQFLEEKKKNSLCFSFLIYIINLLIGVSFINGIRTHGSVR